MNGPLFQGDSSELVQLTAMRKALKEARGVVSSHRPSKIGDVKLSSIRSFKTFSELLR